jgi:hypothetical protein
MKNLKHILLACILLLSAGISFAEIIPAARRTNWNPGIPGGIPERTTVFASVKDSPYGAAGDGKADDTKAIQSAIDACPAGQVVYVPEGIYRITDTIRILKGIVLRGAGPGKSRIKLDGMAEDVIAVGTRDRNKPAVSLTGGYAKGSVRIKAADVSGLAPGDFVIMDQRDDPSINKKGLQDNCSWLKRREHGYLRSVSQTLEIKSIKGKQLTLESPIHYNYKAAFYPEIYKVSGTETGVVKYAGIEDLYLYRTADSKEQGDMILLQTAAYSWIRNVETYMVSGRHICLRNCYRCVVRDSYVHHAWNYKSGGHAYGICVSEHSSNCLVENNISYHVNSFVSYENSGGGNVFGYNYGADAIILPEKDWQPAGILNHCSFSNMELVEGNWVHHMSLDNYHGGTGYMTFFRNYVNGEQLSFGKTNVRNVTAFDITANNYFTNIVGNVLLNPGISGVYELYNVKDGCNSKSAYIIGYYDSCESGLGTDPEVYGNILRHGNFDYITNSTRWDPGNKDHVLPASLYLTSKPAFLKDKPWPPIGPDLTPMYIDIPAKERFEKMPDNTPSDAPRPN